MKSNADSHVSQKNEPKTTFKYPVSTMSNAGESSNNEKCSGQKRKKVLPQTSQKKKFCMIENWKPYEKTAMLKILTEIEQEGNLYLSEDLDSVEQVTEHIIEKCANSNINRSTEDIRKVLLRYMRVCQRERFQHDEPIDKWLEILRALSPHKKSLEQQLKSAIMVAIEEPIPDSPKSFNKIDFKNDFPVPDFAALYKYLACAVSGMPLPELSPIDSLVIEDCVQSLMEQIKSLDDSDLRLNLRKIYIHLNKVEGQAPEEEQEDIVNQLAKGTVCNPLGINQNLIVPVPPD